MKLTTIIGTVIAAVGLAASGATVAATDAPTLAPTVAPTPTATPSATPTPTPPVVTANCAPNSTEYSWTISFSGTESNYNIDLSYNAGATWPDSVASATVPYTITTQRDAGGPGELLGYPLRVRWTDDPGVQSLPANSDSNLCNPVVAVLACDPTNPDGGDMVSWTGAGDFTMLRLTPPVGLAFNVTPFIANGYFGLPLTSTGTWGYLFTGNEIQSRGTFVFAACLVPSVPVTGAGL
jgi:hypothetical protein